MFGFSLLQIFCVLYVVLNILDSYLTTKVLSQGGTELNPIMNYLDKWFGVLPARIITKIFITVVLVGYGYYLVKPENWATIAGGVCAIYAALCVWNFFQIKSATNQ